MANFKTNRTEEDILREMTAILRELKDPRIDPMLTVVRAELSRDLSDCKIFVSSLSGRDAAKRSCLGLDSASGFIRRELFHRLKIRKCPTLHFVADDSIAHSAEINRMLHEIQPPVEEPQEKE
ncbi:30S ribosome-binding factor RbfA [Ruminococcus sp.]|uniref:30S ribosome-binding factor RbfA n=1 Tax=Ruminococcus sp. TaxID=41978 RepID=UPI0025E998D5|nr:30S ribosome-binding factor RbfA [Ruminococcus sp.]